MANTVVVPDIEYKYHKNGYLEIISDYPKKIGKITSSKFPGLAGYDKFNTKGDELLKFLGLTIEEPFNDFYTYRGESGEIAVYDYLKTRYEGSQIFRLDEDYKKNNNYDSFQYVAPLWHPEEDYLINEHKIHKNNELFKYLGGMYDIDMDGVYIEIKSKDQKKKNDYEKFGYPITEMAQAIYNAFLGGKKSAMYYVFFTEEQENEIKKEMKNKKVKEFFTLDVEMKKIDIGKEWERSMNGVKFSYDDFKKRIKDTIKVVELAKQKKLINSNDLDPNTLAQIFEKWKIVKNETKE